MTLPAGALGVWYADDIVTTNGNLVVPNSLSAVPVSRNLLRAPRRLFSDVTFWQSIGTTVTDNNVAGPDALTQASTVVGVGDWSLRFRANGSAFVLWPAGTYTIAVNYIRATGSNQSLKLKDILGAFSSATLTATASWQRASVTFTLAVATTMVIAITSFDGATNATIAVCDCEMFQGSSDLGPEVLDGHLYLGATPTVNAPTAGGGYVDFTAGSGAYGFLQFAVPHSVSTFTASAVINRAAVGNASLRVLLQEAGTTGNANFTLFEAFTLPGKDTASINFSGATGAAAATGLWNQTNAGPHVVTFRYDGTSLTVFYDDTIVFLDSSHVGLSAVNLANLLVGYDEGFGINGGDKIGALAIWPSSLTNAQIYDVIDTWKPRFSLTLHSTYFFAEGDSITAAIATGYVNVFGPTVSPPLFGANFAVSASTFADMNARFAADISVLPPVTRRVNRNFYMCVLIGSNDLQIIDGHVYVNSVGGYIDALQLAGFNKIIIGTVLDRTDAAGNPPFADNAKFFNLTVSRRNFRRNTTPASFAADARLGPPGSGAANNATYFADTVHPTAAGQAIMATILATAFNHPYVALGIPVRQVDQAEWDKYYDEQHPFNGSSWDELKDESARKFAQAKNGLEPQLMKAVSAARQCIVQLVSQGGKVREVEALSRAANITETLLDDLEVEDYDVLKGIDQLQEALAEACDAPKNKDIREILTYASDLRTYIRQLKA